MIKLLFRLRILTLKVKIFLSSGQVVTIYCREFSTSKLSNSKGNREISFTDTDRNWTIDVDQVNAITSENSWFKL